MLFKPLPNDTDSRIATLVDMVSKLTISIDRLATKHEALSQDQIALTTKVGDNERDLRKMENQISKSNGFVDTAKYFGITIVVLLAGGWTSLSTKMDANTTKTDNNAQSIEQIKKDADDTQKQINEISTKVASNREAILSAVRDAKNRGDLK